MNRITLTPRLARVCALTPKSGTCADIGCDHAQVSVWLVRNGRVDIMTAADVNRGPIENAKRVVKASGLENRITCVLSDGLDNIPEQDTVIIAGMGGDLIADILSRAEWTRKGERTLILQPMTAQYRLREFLYENGYRIEKETYVAEKDKLYTILLAKPGRSEIKDISEKYMSRAGETDPMAGEYARRMIDKLTHELNGMKKSAQAEMYAITHREDAIRGLRSRIKEV